MDIITKGHSAGLTEQHRFDEQLIIDLPSYPPRPPQPVDVGKPYRDRIKAVR